MSRALILDATQDHVRATCAKNAARITVIETLPGGSTRVVLANGDAAAIVRRAYGASVITEPVVRTPLSIAAGRAALVRAAAAPAPERPSPASRARRA